MIEAVMLVTLGFLCATLLALAAVPALARRADRLARRRAEAAFPLSLAEIAADRDHLRAELALRARTLEQQAERGFAAKAGAMQEIGRRDMTIAQLERDLRGRETRIAALDSELATTGADLGATRATLAGEVSAHAETVATLEKRVADLASLERSLGEARLALTGTSADLSARDGELAGERATLGRIQALLAEREADLASLRAEADGLRVAQVESRTRIMVLEGERDDLTARLITSDAALTHVRATLKAMTVDRDSERLRANVLDARASQAEARLAASTEAGVVAAADIARVELLREQESAAHQADVTARQSTETALAAAQAATLVERHKRDEEVVALREDLRQREQVQETLHAEIQTLKGGLTQARADRMRLKRELLQMRKAAPAPTGSDATLRPESETVAERRMQSPTKQEAAE